MECGSPCFPELLQRAHRGNSKRLHKHQRTTSTTLIGIMVCVQHLGTLLLSDVVDNPVSRAHHGTPLPTILCFLCGVRKHSGKIAAWNTSFLFNMELQPALASMHRKGRNRM